jgi:sulfotransferase
MKRYFFMAGLPRSGSTLLSSILNQNPQIYSGPNSPVTSLMVATEQYLAQDEHFLAHPKPQAANKIIASIIDNFYSDIDKPIIIDKNRSWVNRINYIPGYIQQEAKVICPVRNTSEILASFIAMHRRNGIVSSAGKINFIDDMLVKSNIPLTDNNRCKFIASPNGILGQSYNGIRQALVDGHQKSIHFVEYDDLINSPEETIRKLYEFLEIPYYEHDFSKIENNNQEKDAEIYGFDDMHAVRPSLEKISTKPEDILSEEILNNCKGSEFWRNLDSVEESEEPSENSPNTESESGWVI